MSGTHAHQTFKAHQPKVYGHRYCQHISLVNGHARMCEEPTGGRTYCKKCAPFGVLTATDPKPIDQTAQPERADWRAQGPTRDKRKRKAA